MSIKRALRFAGVALLAASACGAQTYKIDWYSINSGGTAVSSGNQRIQCAVGQPAVGCVMNSSFVHWIGFLSGESATPKLCATPGEAKLQADGTLVSIAGDVVTSAGGDFAGFFYVEKSDRSSGIRVAVAPGAVPGIARGSVVNVIGTVSSTRDGEKQIAGPMVIIVSSTTPPTPLAMVNKALGGGDLGTPPLLGQYGVTGGAGLNNIGLLVRTWGKVVGTGPGYVLIDDGSGPVTVDTSAFATQPLIYSYISVVGISSLYTSGERYRYILPRNQSDVRVW